MKLLFSLAIISFLSLAAFAQAEQLKPHLPQTRNYNKDGYYFFYDRQIPQKEAAGFLKFVTRGKKDVNFSLYLVPGTADLYFTDAPIANKPAFQLLKKTGEKVSEKGRSLPGAGGGDHYELKYFTGENRLLIFAERWTADYFGTDVYELAGAKLKRLGFLPAGIVNGESGETGFINSPFEKTEVSFDAGKYRITISGNVYSPSAAAKNKRNKLVSSQAATYVYDGKQIRLEQTK